MSYDSMFEYHLSYQDFTISDIIQVNINIFKITFRVNLFQYNHNFS